MRFDSFVAAVLLTAAMSAGSARAQIVPSGFGGRAAVDPDAALERLTAAMSRQPRGSGHDRPGREHGSVRDLVRAGPTRDAYAWLDNK